ncbi:hypothetical protein MRB53_025602 [Persea americana]|uniref:Uncharacterized protein n=1 Tax=Persea americana TaxID=3435 RepID=A0ACC2LFP8_PERAE|nr:hypothetical protein MRB53_025602 [Persea americana]
MADGNGDYVRLGYSNNAESEEIRRQEPESTSKGWCCFCWWMKAISFCLFVLVPAAWFLMWAGLFLLNKALLPMLEWEMGTFSTPMLGLLLFISLAIFPALLLPSAPSMWITGMTFGYGYGFLLIMAATSLGMSLPYFIGSLFRHKIHRWLDKWPKKSAIIRLAGEGDWFHQFQAVALLRISPFPYIVFNYAVVATNVDYSPYILGSLVGTAPEVFLTIYSGILIRNLADATHGHQFISVQQIICDVLGFCTAIAATAAITIYAKRALKSLRIEDELE